MQGVGVWRLRDLHRRRFGAPGLPARLQHQDYQRLRDDPERWRESLEEQREWDPPV